MISLTMNQDGWTTMDVELIWSERPGADAAHEQMTNQMIAQHINADGEGQWLTEDLITLQPDLITVHGLEQATVEEIMIVAREHSIEVTIGDNS